MKSISRKLVRKTIDMMKALAEPKEDEEEEDDEENKDEKKTE